MQEQYSLNPGHKKEFEESKARNDAQGMIRSLQEQIRTHETSITLIEPHSDHPLKDKLPYLRSEIEKLHNEIARLKESYKID